MEPVFSISRPVTNDELGTLILKTLMLSPDEIIEYDPNKMGMKPIFKVMKLRSWISVFRNYKYASIALKDDVLYFLPSSKNFKYKGYSFPLAPIESPYNISTEEIGLLLERCLELCE